LSALQHLQDAVNITLLRPILTNFSPVKFWFNNYKTTGGPKYQRGDKVEFLRNGIVVASLEVFQVYNANAENPVKFHSHTLSADEIICWNWKLLHEESASEVFEVQQGDYGFCRFDEKDLPSTYLLFKVDTIRPRVDSAAVAASGTRTFENLPYDKKCCGGVDGLGTEECVLSDDCFETIKCECGGCEVNLPLLAEVLGAANQLKVFNVNSCKENGELKQGTIKLIGFKAAMNLNNHCNEAFKDRYGAIECVPPSIVSAYLKFALSEEYLKSLGYGGPTGHPRNSDHESIVCGSKFTVAYSVGDLVEARAVLLKGLLRDKQGTIVDTPAETQEAVAEEPSAEEVSKWPLHKQEMLKYCRTDQYAEGQVSDLEKGDCVAGLYDNKYWVSGVVWSAAKLRKVPKKGREKGSKETEERLQYHIKWDDDLAFKANGGTGVYKERKELFRLDNQFVARLETQTTGLSVRYNGSFNVYEDCSIVNYDSDNDTYTVNFKVDGEVCEGIKRHWIAETTVELPFLPLNQKVSMPNKTRGNKRKRSTATKTDNGPAKKSKRLEDREASTSEENTADVCNVNEACSIGSDDDCTQSFDEDDKDEDYDSGCAESNEEDSDDELQKLRSEWAVAAEGKNATVASKRSIEIKRRSLYPALQTLRDENVRTGKWTFVNARALKTDEVDMVLEAYDEYLLNVRGAGLEPGHAASIVTKKRAGGKAAKDERLLFKYSQKIRLINVVTDPRHAKLYVADLKQKSRKELDENKTGWKSDLWSTVAAEFAKETAYNTCLPSCDCHRGAFPEAFNSKLIFPWDAQKLHSEWHKIINGFSKAYNKINASGNHDHSCYRDCNRSGYAFDDYKVEILYFSLMMKHLGADGESFKRACIMSVSENVRVDTLDEEEEKDKNPNCTNDDGSPKDNLLKKREYKNASTVKKKNESGGSGGVSEATSAMKNLVDVVNTMCVRRDSKVEESVSAKDIRNLSESLDLNERLQKSLKKKRRFKEKHPDCVSEESDCYAEYQVLCDSVRKLRDLIESRQERALLAA
jgi:hypothetical protein